MTVSVIIPVYNTEAYLKDCLDSIVNQTYRNLEIICVNDGSLDNSLKILEEYKAKDSRIILINQENKGQSAARNAAIEIATGNFISFVDSDDILDTNYFEKTVGAITENECDIAVTSILRTGKFKKKNRLKYDKIEVFSSLEEKIKVCDVPRCCYACGKLYNAKLIKNSSFKENVFFEDVLWIPEILKNSGKIVTVPEVNYYYVVNMASTVKKRPSRKKQQDLYNAKSYIVEFFKKNNLELKERDKHVTKRIFYFLNLPILKIKEYKNSEIFILFGLLPIFKKKIKLPIIKDNTFIVSELCSSSHNEVVPGFAKYLLDLGYHVSVLVDPKRYKEGLFSRFKDENLTLNQLTRKEARKYFKNNSLDNVKGVMITTVGKLCDCIHYEQAYEAFSPNLDRKKLLFVEHESKASVDKGTWKEDLIILRKLNYKEAKATVVNPHYFGEIKITPKNDVVNFITVGAIKPNKMNSDMIVNGVETLVNKGITNFKITVIGKGNLKHIPKELRKYFDIKGRAPFSKMYDEIEKADFFLMSYGENNADHARYNTTGTSGNFQLIYGFLKPCIMTKTFAPINELDETSAVLYEGDENFSNAMARAVMMSKEEYGKMQDSLKKLVLDIEEKSKQNLKALIDKGTYYGE